MNQLSPLNDFRADGVRAAIPAAVRVLAICLPALVLAPLGFAQDVRYALDGADPNDLFGSSVAGIGDVNGDGFDDFCVGARAVDSNGGNAGSVYVYSGIDGSLLQTLNGPGVAAEFGWSLASAGDVNGDGSKDILVGACRASVAGVMVGQAFVYSGADYSLLHSFSGTEDGEYLGYDLCAAGDVNGDGHADFAVGVPFNDDVDVDAGKVHLYSGFDGAIIRTYFGAGAGAFFGTAVSSAGDLDGDQIPDLLVGASKEDGLALDAGSARVFSGADGSVIHALFGNSFDDRLGHAVAGIADVNGDGIEDFLVGEQYDDSFAPDAGLASVYSGADASVLRTYTGHEDGELFGWRTASAGDVNADGVADYIISSRHASRNRVQSGSAGIYSGADGLLLFLYNGETAFSLFGDAIDAAGDSDGDGYADIVVGAMTSNLAGANSGRVRLFSGRPNMMTSATQISAASGALVNFDIDFASNHALDNYLLFGSQAQFPLPTLPSGNTLAISDQDPLFQLMLSGNTPPVFQNTAGILDANGDAQATLNLGPGQAAPQIGQSYLFSAVAYTPPSNVNAYSMTTAITVLP